MARAPRNLEDEDRPQTTLPYRVRFDEATPDGLVRTSTLLRWAQDVAWVHSERLGFTRAWYTDRGLAWLVRGVELAVLGPIPTGRELATTTQVVGYRKVWARRRTDFREHGGAILVWAHTDWVMTDRRGAPVRVPEDFAAFLVQPVPSFTPTRVTVSVPSEGAIERILPVRLRELDPMGHVNNAVYLDHLEEGVAAMDRGAEAIRSMPRTYRLEYLLPAEPGTELVATTWSVVGGGYDFRLADRSGADLFRGRLEASERGDRR